jgi:hypothetical protein
MRELMLPSIRNVVIGAFTVASATVMIAGFLRQGPPYFARPVTTLDHFFPGGTEHPTAVFIRICERVAPRIPRGATVMVFKPSQAPNFDTTIYATSLGVLSRLRVVAPPLRDPLPDFVVTIGESLDHPSYALVERFPEGLLYKRTS